MDASMIEGDFPRYRYALNRGQWFGMQHPFTCPHRADHPDVPGAVDTGVLIATDAGWRCPSCDYQQAWAWQAMAAVPYGWATLETPELSSAQRAQLATALGDALCRSLVAAHRLRRVARHPAVVDVLLADLRAAGQELRGRIDRLARGEA